MSNEIEFPRFYQGIYQRVEAPYRPLLRDAMERIRSMDVSENLRPFLAFQVWENPQPSFMLFPLMFLATAEAAGGIKDEHLDYLPTIILASELTAVADDAVDRTPCRSDRPTFAARYGDASAVPMGCALTSLVLDRSRRYPRVFDAAIGYFVNFFGLELWERSHLYPTRDGFADWLEHRYLQGIIATEYVLNSALFLSGAEPWPRAAITSLCQIGQDVDDIVNLCECREQEGENDDLQSGVVTRPLIIATAQDAELADEVEELWDRYRPLAETQLSIPDLQLRLHQVRDDTRPLYARIRRAIIENGIPHSISACHEDFRSAVDQTPARFRPLMEDLAMAFLDRLGLVSVAEFGQREEDAFAAAG